MLNRRELDELVRMLQGNIARLMLSDDAAEIECMRDWAHHRIDLIADARIQQVNDGKSMISPTTLKSAFRFVLNPEHDYAALLALKTYVAQTANNKLAKKLEEIILEIEERNRESDYFLGT